METIASIPWSIAIIGCLTLGLAPFSPPHIVEKLQLLASGDLVRVIDWFDLVFHALPWILLFTKAAVWAVASRSVAA